MARLPLRWRRTESFRHNLTRSKKYNRRGFGHKEETMELLNREYTSDIINDRVKPMDFVGESRERSRLLMKPGSSFRHRNSGSPTKSSTIQHVNKGKKSKGKTVLELHII